ncbi:MAG: penicillin-binding protein 2 [Pseudomonadota bacterium]
MNLGSHDPEREKTFKRRTFLFSGGLIALFGGVTYRLAQLQLVEHERYANLARENQFNRRLLTPLRGEIVDRFGTVIASNRKNFRVLLIPEQTRNVGDTLDALEGYIDISAEKRARILRQIRRLGRFTPVEIANNLDWDTFSKINYQVPHLPGVIPEEGRTRDYPLGNGSAFVIGYVGSPNDRDLQDPALSPTERKMLREPGFKVGREGLEKRYDDELRGKAGEKLVKVNAHGRVIDEIDDGMTPPEQGQQLALTIDSELQMAAMESLGDQSGSAVVVDVKTGEILVLASTPAFNPNDFNVGIDPGLWRSLNSDATKPLVNKPLSGVYPPASTFKLISAIAAQEAGIPTSFGVRCRGSIRYGGNTHRCWKTHGWVDMRGAIKHSCDVFFYEVAKKLEIDLLAKVAREFGLGQVFEIGIPGQKKGIIPDRAWKASYFANNPENQQWFGGETLSVIIGQGYVTSTPLQLAIMAARIATGRTIRPSLVRGVGETLVPTPDAAPLEVNPKFLNVVRAGMDAVVNEVGGTARRSRLDLPDMKGVTMAGKTGTGQVASLQRDPKTGRILKNEELPRHLRDHALFVSFAPVDNPRYACAIVVEHGASGSRAAAPVAKKVMEAVMKKDPALRPAYDPRIVAQAPGGTGATVRGQKT